MNKFIIKKRRNGEFQFNLLATNGQIILSSEGYSSKAACLNGVESVKKNAQEDGRFERKEASDGRFYFVLKATNGQVIGQSQMYASKDSRDNGVESVKKNAPDAEVVDETIEA